MAWRYCSRERTVPAGRPRPGSRRVRGGPRPAADAEPGSPRRECPHGVGRQVAAAAVERQLAPAAAECRPARRRGSAGHGPSQARRRVTPEVAAGVRRRTVRNQRMLPTAERTNFVDGPLAAAGPDELAHGQQRPRRVVRSPARRRAGRSTPRRRGPPRCTGAVLCTAARAASRADSSRRSSAFAGRRPPPGR